MKYYIHCILFYSIAIGITNTSCKAEIDYNRLGYNIELNIKHIQDTTKKKIDIWLRSNDQNDISTPIYSYGDVHIGVPRVFKYKLRRGEDLSHRIHIRMKANGYQILLATTISKKGTILWNNRHTTSFLNEPTSNLLSIPPSPTNRFLLPMSIDKAKEVISKIDLLNGAESKTIQSLPSFLWIKQGAHHFYILLETKGPQSTEVYAMVHKTVGQGHSFSDGPNMQYTLNKRINDIVSNSNNP